MTNKYNMDEIVKKSPLYLIGICGGIGSSTAEVKNKIKFYNFFFKFIKEIIIIIIISTINLFYLKVLTNLFL